MNIKDAFHVLTGKKSAIVPPGNNIPSMPSGRLNLFQNWAISSTLSDHYANCSAIYSLCLRRIADRAKTLPFQVVLPSGKKAKQNRIQTMIEGKVNPENTWSEYIEALVNNYLRTGNALTRVVGTPGYPIALWHMESNRTAVIESHQIGSGLISHYIDNSINSSQMQIKPEFVINSRTYNTYSRIKGLPRIHASMNQLSSSTYIEQYKNSFMKNFGAVGLVVYTEETYTIEEKIGFKNLIDSVYSGAENAGKTIVIDNAGKVDSLGHSPVEADLLKAEAMTGGIIADVMGVPLELVPGYANGSSTYENQREARKSFLVDTVFGVLDSILDDLNAYFFNDGEKIVVMEELVPELKRTDKEIADLWLLSPNERRSLMGFEPIDDENMNKIYIPSGLTPIDEVNGDMGDGVL